MTQTLSHTPTWSSWINMKRRCLYQSYSGYPNYGGRGIKICDRWLSFKNFYADMGERPEGTSLDRIDVNGDYCPENCRWATSVQQARNTTRVKVITYAGKTLCLSAWAEELGISRKTLLHRLNYGWSVEKAFKEPVRRRSFK